MAKRQGSDTVRVPVPMPYKGVNRAFARGLQPEGTTWKAINIVPFDRQGRRRPSVRGGAGRTDVLDQALPVRALHVASYADTTAGVGTFFSDNFNSYSVGDLMTVAPSTWVTYNGATGTTQAANRMNVTAGGKVRPANNGGVSRLLTSLSLGTSYSIEIDVTIGTGWVNNWSGGVMLRYNGAHTTGMLFRIFRTGNIDYVHLADQTGATLSGGNLSSGTADATFTAVVGTTYRIKITWSGNTFTAYRDGVQIFTGVSTYSSANAGIGLQLGLGTTMELDNFTVTGEGANDATVTRTALKLIGVSGTKVYTGEPGSMAAATAVASFPIDSTSVFVSAATLYGFTYFADGNGKPKKLNLATNTMVTFSEASGTAPSGATIAVGWRGRLLLSGIESDPQNIHASKLGDPLTWNTTTAPSVETDPWSLNFSLLGLVGQPIHAIMPISDDVCLVGCEQSLWIIRGDIASNGSVDNISETVGVLGQNAWCRGPDGSVFFVGPNGFYKCSPDGSSLQEVSRDTYPQFFTGYDRSHTYVSLVYDPGRYGIWIFMAATDSADQPIEFMFYDLVATGFWPQKFDNYGGAGPISAVMWDAFDSTERYPVIGGYVGQLSAISYTNRYDFDGSVNQAIRSELWFGPFTISSVDDSIFTRLDITGGEVRTGDNSDVWNVNWNVRGGITAYDVMEGTSVVSSAGNISTAGRFHTEYPRVRGGFFTLELSNTNDGDYFSVEDIIGHFVPAGRQRA